MDSAYGVEYPKYLEIKISKAASSEEERREIDGGEDYTRKQNSGWNASCAMEHHSRADSTGAG